MPGTRAQRGSPTSQLAEAERLLRAGDFPAAARLCKAAIKQRATPTALLLLGIALSRQGKHAEARKHLAHARRLEPARPEIAFEIAQSLQAQERLDDAIAALDQGLAAAPGDTRLVRAKAELLRMARRHEEACDLLRPLLTDPAAADPHLLIAFGATAPRVGKADEAVHLLAARAHDESIPDPERMLLLFTLADALERTREYERAFDALRRANALKGARFNSDRHAAMVDRLIDAWTPDAVAALPRGDSSDLPVFIVGMPRSGTSLVEQIIASHPRAFGAGELNDVPKFVLELTGSTRPYLDDLSLLTPQAVARFARRYLADRRRDARAGGPIDRVTDKLPLNCLHLGVIAACFPAARVIHCRRDPLDTCLSCYAHDFGGALSFTYDLEHLGRFYRDYERLTAHWASVLDLPIHTLTYEDLVRDLEPHARGLIDFLGLDWDDACLRYHESSRLVRTVSQDQVRQKAYTSSIGRWKRFEPFLGPLKDALSQSRLE